MKGRFSKVWATIALVFSVATVHAQQISPQLYGQNAWLPDSVGTVRYYGKLDQRWQDIKGSGVKMMRYGGIAPDQNRPTTSQYIKIVDSCRANGIEPMLQVSYNKGMYTAAQAAEVVKYVNITKGRNVKYWIIGNEPDLKYGYTTAAQIASYIKPFATAMKAVDPSIKIMGPECAWYNHSIIEGITTPGGAYDLTGKDANGNYYLDYISFHTYPFNGSQTRDQVINHMTQPNKFEHNLEVLKQRLASCNSYHGRSGVPVKMAVTEANISWQNDAVNDLYGNCVNSFIAGQFWADMLGISMKKGVDIVNFWSVIEGNSQQLNIGYIDKYTGAKKPVYHHFQMVADNFRGTYLNTVDNLANVKTFASKDGQQIAVMICNQDMAGPFTYTVRLDGAAPSQGQIKIQVPAAVAREYSSSIQGQGTQVLVFDLVGNLRKKYEYNMVGHADVGLSPKLVEYSANGDLLTTTGGSKPKKKGTLGGGEEDLQEEGLPADFSVFEIAVGPNPTVGRFNVRVRSGNPQLMSFRVFDLNGRLVEEVKDAEPNLPRSFGDRYPAGAYFIEVEQGFRREVLKVIKN